LIYIMSSGRQSALGLEVPVKLLVSANKTHDFRKWHLSDVLTPHRYVRFPMHCRRDVLAASLSAHDPKQSSASVSFCSREAGCSPYQSTRLSRYNPVF
jgi:hypothetical protein